METRTRQRRAPRAWLIENGVRTKLKYTKTTDKLSPVGIWMKEHPFDPELVKDWDMRAVLK